MSKGEKRKTYTVDQKVTAVLALYSNDRDFLDTATRLHLPVQTLRIWEKQYGKQVKDKINIPDSAILALQEYDIPLVDHPEVTVGLSEALNIVLGKEEMTQLANLVYQNAIQLKRLAIRRAYELLPSARNLRDIGYIISVINDIAEVYLDEEDDGTGYINHNPTIRRLTERMIANANKVKQEADKQQNSKQDEPV